MEKQKDILLLFLLKDFCKNNSIEDKFELIKNKLESENILEKELGDLSLTQHNSLVEYLPIKRKNSSKIIFYENIGSGSFGNVFKCYHKLDKNDYAIKIIPVYNDIKKEKYIEEVEMMAKFDHPNIVRYYNSWIEEILPNNTNLYLEEESSSNTGLIENCEITEFLFIQMELCSGNLSEYLINRTDIEYKQSLHIYNNILQGINYLHKMNIIHRDIKPSNIMFTKNGIAKIGDFGMSIKFEKEGKPIIKTENEYGSYNYLAPESIQNKEYSKYSDIYSLGIILFELLSIFDTFMEKQEKINLLKKELYLDDEFVNRFQNESKFIKSLLNENKFERPLIETILKKMC